MQSTKEITVEPTSKLYESKAAQKAPISVVVVVVVVCLFARCCFLFFLLI